jgi:hypothetical protein
MEKVDTVAEVKTKELPTGVTIYLLLDSQGNEYSTRDRDLARVGHAAWESGQHVHFDYDEKKGGQFNQFTNRYLNSLDPVEDGTSPFAPPFPGNEPDRQPPGLFDDAAPEPAVVSTDKDLQIAKAVALKAGVEILQYLPEDQRTVSNVVTAAEFFTRWLTTWRP